APFHTLELGERLERDLDVDARVRGTAYGRERVLEVVRADERPADLTHPLATARHAEARLRTDQLVRGRPHRIGTFPGAERLDGRPYAHGQQLLDVRVVAADADQ